MSHLLLFVSMQGRFVVSVCAVLQLCSATVRVATVLLQQLTYVNDRFLVMMYDGVMSSNVT